VLETKTLVAVPVTKRLVAVPVTKMLVVVPVTKMLVAVPVTKRLEAVVRVLPIAIVQLAVSSVADSVMSVILELVAVDDTTMPVAVDETAMPVAVDDTKTPVAIDETAMPDVVLRAKTAVAVANGTSIKYQAVPSFAIAQFVLLAAVDVIGKNKFVTDTVLGVVVTFLNVTDLVPPIAHAPVNVQMRKTFAVEAGSDSNLVCIFVGPLPSGTPSTRAIVRLMSRCSPSLMRKPRVID